MFEINVIGQDFFVHVSGRLVQSIWWQWAESLSYSTGSRSTGESMPIAGSGEMADLPPECSRRSVAPGRDITRLAATLGGFLPGHEAGVILGGVDPAGRFGHHLQRDREASLQRTQLLEPLALFEGRWRQCRKPQ